MDNGPHLAFQGKPLIPPLDIALKLTVPVFELLELGSLAFGILNKPGGVSDGWRPNVQHSH